MVPELLGVAEIQVCRLRDLFNLGFARFLCRDLVGGGKTNLLNLHARIAVRLSLIWPNELRL